MGSSGGCFVAGTKILVPGVTESSPYKEVSIEDVNVGDEVISFNEKWDLQVSKVLKTSSHDNRHVIKVSSWGNEVPLIGTHEHWVMSPGNRFVCLGTLSTEDALVGQDKQALPVTSIEPAGTVKVFNLIVAPNHTYVANGILVHNGGGGGGKSESSSSNPLQGIAAPLAEDAVAQYQKLYADYYWPIEEGLAGLYKNQLAMYSPYAENRFGELIGMAEETNPMLDDNKKSLIRRLVEGEDVLADRYRSEASNDVASSFAQQRQQMMNTANQYGISPTSGSFLGGLRDFSNNEALAQAQARTGASRRAEDDSLARQTQALDLYTNPELGTAPTPGLAMNTLFAGVGSSQDSSSEQSKGGGGLLGIF